MPPVIVRRYLEADGVRISYLTVDSSPSSDTLLLIHGAGVSARTWVHQLRGVAHVVRPIAIDLPGRRESDAIADPTLATYAETKVPFTPAVQVAYALDEALAELLEEGVAARIRRYAAAAELLRAGFERRGIQFLLPPELRSNSITALRLPQGRSYQELHDGLKERGFVVYEGQGRLQRDIFRVANMGHLTTADFERFLVALDAVLGR